MFFLRMVKICCDRRGKKTQRNCQSLFGRMERKQLIQDPNNHCVGLKKNPKPIQYDGNNQIQMTMDKTCNQVHFLGDQFKVLKWNDMFQFTPFKYIGSWNLKRIPIINSLCNEDGSLAEPHLKKSFASPFKIKVFCNTNCTVAQFQVATQRLSCDCKCHQQCKTQISEILVHTMSDTFSFCVYAFLNASQFLMLVRLQLTTPTSVSSHITRW